MRGSAKGGLQTSADHRPHRAELGRPPGATVEPRRRLRRLALAGPRLPAAPIEATASTASRRLAPAHCPAHAMPTRRLRTGSRGKAGRPPVPHRRLNDRRSSRSNDRLAAARCHRRGRGHGDRAAPARPRRRRATCRQASNGSQAISPSSRRAAGSVHRPRLTCLSRPPDGRHRGDRRQHSRGIERVPCQVLVTVADWPPDNVHPPRLPQHLDRRSCYHGDPACRGSSRKRRLDSNDSASPIIRDQSNRDGRARSSLLPVDVCAPNVVDEGADDESTVASSRLHGGGCVRLAARLYDASLLLPTGPSCRSRSGGAVVRRFPA